MYEQNVLKEVYETSAHLYKIQIADAKKLEAQLQEQKAASDASLKHEEEMTANSESFKGDYETRCQQMDRERQLKSHELE